MAADFSNFSVFARLFWLKAGCFEAEGSEHSGGWRCAQSLGFACRSFDCFTETQLTEGLEASDFKAWTACKFVIRRATSDDLIDLESVYWQEKHQSCRCGASSFASKDHW